MGIFSIFGRTPSPRHEAPAVERRAPIRSDSQPSNFFETIAQIGRWATGWLPRWNLQKPSETKAAETQGVVFTRARHTPAVAAALLGAFLVTSGAQAGENRQMPPIEVAPIVQVVAESPTPPPAASRSYVVRAGDSVWWIAKKTKVSEEQIRRLNPNVSRAGKIFPGQELKLPAAAVLPKVTSERGVALPQPVVEVAHPIPIEMVQDRPLVRRNAVGPHVVAIENRLHGLGYDIGIADGIFDGKLRRGVRAFQMANALNVDGVVGPKTWEALGSPTAIGHTAIEIPAMARYAPGAADTVDLFKEAARRIGVPEDWASSRALRNLLFRESDGYVGRPNYTYGARARSPERWVEIHDELKLGRRTADSSATGLGQLLLENVDQYYPSGRAGIGNPMEEAIGMLAYIEERYGSPQRAWSLYNKLHEGY